MRTWPTLLLGSALLLLVSALIHFYYPTFKEPKSRRPYKVLPLKTLKTDEEKVRTLFRHKRSENKSAEPSKNKLNYGEYYSNVLNEMIENCEDGSKKMEESPDLIDPSSKYYTNPLRAKDMLTLNISIFSHALYQLAFHMPDLEEKLLESSEEKIDFSPLQTHLIELEDMARTCGVGDYLGPTLMTFVEVVSEKNNPALKPLMIDMFISLADAAFSVKTFSAFEIGLGALRNMNTYGVLSPQESEDLLILSDRVSFTYENYRKEVGEKADSMAELEEAFLYYQIEREVLFELLQEYINNLQATYPSY